MEDVMLVRVDDKKRECTYERPTGGISTHQNWGELMHTKLTLSKWISKVLDDVEF